MTPSSPPVRRAVPSRRATAIVVSAVSGGLVSTQSRVNGELGDRLHDGYVAAVISFGSGLVIMLVVMAVSSRGRAGLRVVRASLAAGTIRPWHVAGGLAGGCLVLSQGTVAGSLGIALFTVALVCGQSMGGLVLDRVGVGAEAPRAVTVRRVLGASLSVVAAAISVGPHGPRHASWLLVVVPVAVGAGLGWQRAVNGVVATTAGSAVTATFVNFVGGTVLLAALAAVRLVVHGAPSRPPSDPLLYLGGLIGVLFIAGFAVATAWIGVLLQSLAAIAGQLAASLVLDLVAPIDGASVGWSTAVGLMLTLVGVLLAARSPAPR